jgi:dipeptidyl aminopeptidase/acylaminoacyl peptidase
MVGSSSGNDALARAQQGARRAGLTVQLFHSERSSQGRTTQNMGARSYGADLSLVEVTSGKVDRIVRGVSLARTAFSPDGRHVAFSQITGDNVAGTHIQLYTLDVFSLDTRRLTTPVPPAQIGRWGSDFSWSPDSRLLAYRLGHDSGEVSLVSLSGPSRPATTAAHPPFMGIPSWDASGERLILISEEAVWTVGVADGEAREIANFPGKTVRMLVPVGSRGDRLWLRDGGQSALAVVSDGIRKELHRVSFDGGASDLLFGEQKEYSGLTRYEVLAAPATGRVVYAAEDARHPEDLWITHGDFSGSAQLTHLNPGINRVAMGSMQLVEWTGGDGLPYVGALLLPSGYEQGRRYPLVTYVYPKDVVPDANRFGSNHLSNEYFNLQLLATRGYAVLYSGATWQPADREPMQAVANAVFAGIDHVIGMGIADPERLGVFGASAGGYSTLALIVQSTRFKAAMVQAGPGNLLSGYGNLDDKGYSHGLAIAENSFRFPDHPWNDRERYIRNSPWFFLDRIETPLLLIQGTDDSAVIVSQSNEVFVGLRRLGKTAQYARYAGEGHGLISLPNRLDAGQRFLDWFERYLEP